MRPASAVVALAAAWGALAAPDARAAPGYVLKQGPRFRVHCHFADEAVAAAALDTVEAIWPTASVLYGVADVPEGGLYDVHLFRTPADYLKEERGISGKFDRNLAFTSFDTKAAYVALQPNLADEALAATGLTGLTRRMLAHEAAHVVRYRNFPNYQHHPKWFEDGNSQWIEDETMTARGWAPALEEDPHVSWHMVLAKALLAGGGLPSARRILADDLDDLSFYARYAVRRLLFRRLVTRKDAPAFRAALTTALALPDGPDLAKRFTDVVLGAYATEGGEGLDVDFEQYVRSLAPAWDEDASGRALSTAGDAWVQTAFSDAGARAWRTAPAGAEAYEIRGQIEILPGAGKFEQMNLLLGRDPLKGFVSVAFGAHDGVAVWRRGPTEADWRRLASAPTKAVQLWRRLPFRVAVDGARVTVRVDGTEVVSVDVEDLDLSGPWGLGVQDGGAGIWRGVKLERTKK